MGMRSLTPGFVWRYGIMPWGADFTDLDQWISARYLKEDAPEAPIALREALEQDIVTKHPKWGGFVTYRNILLPFPRAHCNVFTPIA